MRNRHYDVSEPHLRTVATIPQGNSPRTFHLLLSRRHLRRREGGEERKRERGSGKSHGCTFHEKVEYRKICCRNGWSECNFRRDERSFSPETRDGTVAGRELVKPGKRNEEMGNGKWEMTKMGKSNWRRVTKSTQQHCNRARCDDEEPGL